MIRIFGRRDVKLFKNNTKMNEQIVQSCEIVMDALTTRYPRSQKYYIRRSPRQYGVIISFFTPYYREKIEVSRRLNFGMYI